MTDASKTQDSYDMRSYPPGVWSYLPRQTEYGTVYDVWLNKDTEPGPIITLTRERNAIRCVEEGNRRGSSDNVELVADQIGVDWDVPYSEFLAAQLRYNEMEYMARKAANMVAQRDCMNGKID